jgi:hypothetical protein
MEPDIGLLELVDAQRFIQRVSDLVESHGQLEGYGIGGVLQTGEVLLEEEEFPSIRAHGLVDPIAVKETVVEN